MISNKKQLKNVFPFSKELNLLQNGIKTLKISQVKTTEISTEKVAIYIHKGIQEKPLVRCLKDTLILCLYETL